MSKQKNIFAKIIYMFSQLDSQTKKNALLFFGAILVFGIVDAALYLPKNAIHLPKPSFKMDMPKILSATTKKTVLPTSMPQQNLVSQQNPTILEVSKLMDLPKGEEPLVATVTDPSQLQDQDFFKSAIKGDKVIVYKKNKLAILYRPSTKKIVVVAPASFEVTQPSPSVSVNPSATPTQESSSSATLR